MWRDDGSAYSKEKSRPKGSAGTGYCETERTGYLSGCVATACWWCQKQPPSPTAAIETTIAMAKKVRIVSPPFLHANEKHNPVLHLGV